MLKPYTPTIISTVISAVQTGASMYQAMSLFLASLTQLWQCFPSCIVRIATLISEILPSDVTPIGNSVLLQILSAALYSTLLEKSEKCVQLQKSCSASSSRSRSTERLKSTEKKLTIIDGATNIDPPANSVESIALAIAEGLCSIDEDNKHTEEIEAMLEKAKKCLENDDSSKGCESVEFNQQMAEVLASDLLLTTEGKTAVRVSTNIFLMSLPPILHRHNRKPF